MLLLPRNLRKSANLMVALAWALGFMAVEGSAQSLPITGPEDDGCWTQVIYDEKYPQLRADPEACTQMGDCDIPSIRDSWIPDTTDPVMVMRIYFHVMRNDDGTNPACSEQDVADAMEALNEHYLPLRIEFEYGMRFVNSTQFRLLSASSEFDAMKTQYAITPDSQLNVYVASVNVGGSVFSFGTFPWDPDALTVRGGIVMNNTQMPPYNYRTLTHEVGHNLGLWHTFHGVDEVTTCGACYESPGAGDGDVTGDFCADTDPTPTNYGCGPPGGNDPCTGIPWGTTDYRNHMSYSSCRDNFSIQQWGRMHCWTNDVLSGWVLNVQIFADTVFGPVPLDVNFTGVTPKTVLTWDWDFGDGGGADVQNPPHSYVEPGLYDVAVTIEATDGTYQTVRKDYISAYADTLIPTDVTGSIGSPVRVDVYARNFLPLQIIKVPFSWAGPLNLVFDSASLVGLRTENAEAFQQVAYDPFVSRAAYQIRMSAFGIGDDLAPDSGAIMSLFFKIPPGASGGPNPITIQTLNSHEPQFTAAAGVYEPVLLAGSVDICLAGDVDGDMAGPNVADLTYLVDYLFNGGPPPPVPGSADVDASGGDPNVADVTYLVDFLFNGGPPPSCL